MRFIFPGIIFIFLCLICGCNAGKVKLFTKLSEDNTGIDFRNLLKEDNPEFNIILYPYFYNGGGIAVGDINNDGLPDICFTGNMVKNRLYLNKGNFKFEDITEKSGIASKEGWCTGVTMADVNGDGKLDIYICRSGLSNINFRKNLLFINNGDLTFTEKAEEYGLADAGYSTQASFFDYDKDGDLDMILINQSTPGYSKGRIEYLYMRIQPADSTLKNKLFRNDNGHYTNVSAQAGITSNPLSFSLGLSTTDINKDGWPDIYIANDFKEPDYYFINNRDGTFTEQLGKSFSHTSLYGMGIDVADYNNDGFPDLIELDMLPEGNHAQKMHMGIDGFDQYNPLFQNGMPYQYMKNSLQKNNGDGTFSEIGQLAGVSNTDWSWSPLFCDFDNDGMKDLFVSNGYKRDNTDIEFLKYAMDKSIKIQLGDTAESAAEYISHMPGIKPGSYIYQNAGNDKFVNKIKDWGLEEKIFSNGAIYADLDNDGDMDLVTNNVDDYAGVYKNNSETLNKNNFLKIKLQGEAKNSLGFGAKVYVWKDGKSFYQEENPVRGYCSSVDPVLNFGLGKMENADSVSVIWNDDKQQVLKNVKTNQTLIIKQAEANSAWYLPANPEKYFSEMKDSVDFTHVENDFNDFVVQTLLPSYLSRLGPCMATADVNKDGKEDIFAGGAKGQSAQLFIQDADGNFVNKLQPAFVKDYLSEDVAAIFFDADKDGDMDLYVGSGGYEFPENDPALQDRVYINDGQGNFAKKERTLPSMLITTGCVKAADIDGDGDMDLFVGGRCMPGKYPLTPESKILLNDGTGNFTDATSIVCPAIEHIGMVTDALWLDVNKDGTKDLIIVGEWMSPKIFINQKGKLTDASSTYIKFAAYGWWNKIYADDFDNDGDTDLVLGNQGWNNQFAASEQKPMNLYYKDFDGNGSVDPFMFYYIGDTSYPAYSRDDVVQQVPFLNKKYLYYTNYADATLHDMFTKEQLNDAGELKANNLSTIYLENKGNEFVPRQLPAEAQYAPVYAITSADVNKDGNKDLVLAGNNTWTRIKFGRYDASHAVLLLGDGKGNFSYVPQWQSGFNVQGNVRSLERINNTLIFGINNSKMISYSFK
ncbi:MAG: ASPIC/UnbV domain protein [Chitinophagaceae bacterium]|nr:ASPIC/UnbV domain protein [Chitinophagaceae bacterium]